MAAARPDYRSSHQLWVDRLLNAAERRLAETMRNNTASVINIKVTNPPGTGSQKSRKMRQQAPTDKRFVANAAGAPRKMKVSRTTSGGKKSKASSKNVAASNLEPANKESTPSRPNVVKQQLTKPGAKSAAALRAAMIKEEDSQEESSGLAACLKRLKLHIGMQLDLQQQSDRAVNRGRRLTGESSRRRGVQGLCGGTEGEGVQVFQVRKKRRRQAQKMRSMCREKEETSLLLLAGVSSRRLGASPGSPLR